jgi:hypothetical protein
MKSVTPQGITGLERVKGYKEDFEGCKKGSALQSMGIFQ